MIETDELTHLTGFKAAPGQIVGYHSSIHSAAIAIESAGFLPNKILTLAEHSRLIAIAQEHGVDTLNLRGWLELRSVTFTQRPEEALKHIAQGSAGGQGLKNLTTIIEALSSQTLAPDDRVFTDSIGAQIRAVQTDKPITYAVDLTGLGPRLTRDHLQPFYYFRWNPALDLPETSEVGPDRILLKLRHP